MKTYFAYIATLQKILLFISIGILVVLPEIIVYVPSLVTSAVSAYLYDISHYTLLFVMTVRPLADIITGTKLIRPLVILRKGVGVLSASIVVSFIFAKILTLGPAAYFANYATLSYWSLDHFALFAHAADVAAILLLATSNNLSKQLLGKNWKRIQRLSYVYFYGSAVYLLVVYGMATMFWSMLLVTALTITAWLKNKTRTV